LIAHFSGRPVSFEMPSRLGPRWSGPIAHRDAALPNAGLAIEVRAKETIARFFNIGIVLTITLILSPFGLDGWSWWNPNTDGGLSGNPHPQGWGLKSEAGPGASRPPEGSESRARADQQRAGDAGWSSWHNAAVA